MAVGVTFNPTADAGERLMVTVGLITAAAAPSPVEAPILTTDELSGLKDFE